MSFQGCDNETALSYISSFCLGSTTLQNSDSAMWIREIHLRTCFKIINITLHLLWGNCLKTTVQPQ